MLDREEPVVNFKLDVLERALPGCESAVLFGDMWRIDGGYTVECAKHCDRVLLIDTLETAAWQQERIAEPKIDFRKGDFSDPLFMESVRESFSLGVAFDILLHQPTMLGTLALMARNDRRPFLRRPADAERAGAPRDPHLPAGEPRGGGALSARGRSLRPQGLRRRPGQPSHWIWAMTPSFLTTAMIAEGFDLVYEETLAPLPNPNWSWWGAVYERVRPRSAGHWTNLRVEPGLYGGGW